MTTNEHIERLESLAVELDMATAFLDPPTPGETYWQELDAVSLRAGAAALREANRWRPIAEAPRDNDGIEAIDSRTGFVRVVDYYKGYPPNWTPCWALQGASNECYPLDYFTHYRPIPHPPESA